jgi:hypothetical protein
MDDWDSIPGGGKDCFVFATTSRPALTPTQPHIQLISQSVFPGVKQPKRETDRSPPSSTEVKNS